jgi:hypothetical protein
MWDNVGKNKGPVWIISDSRIKLVEARMVPKHPPTQKPASTISKAE